jgi:hypothetical protein
MTPAVLLSRLPLLPGRSPLFSEALQSCDLHVSAKVVRIQEPARLR